MNYKATVVDTTNKSMFSFNFDTNQTNNLKEIAVIRLAHIKGSLKGLVIESVVKVD